jgi:hypothetical protein
MPLSEHNSSRSGKRKTDLCELMGFCPIDFCRQDEFQNTHGKSVFQSAQFPFLAVRPSKGYHGWIKTTILGPLLIGEANDSGIGFTPSLRMGTVYDHSLHASHRYYRPILGDFKRTTNDQNLERVMDEISFWHLRWMLNKKERYLAVPTSGLFHAKKLGGNFSVSPNLTGYFCPLESRVFRVAPISSPSGGLPLDGYLSAGAVLTAYQ